MEPRLIDKVSENGKWKVLGILGFVLVVLYLKTSIMKRPVIIQVRSMPDNPINISVPNEISTTLRPSTTKPSTSKPTTVVPDVVPDFIERKNFYDKTIEGPGVILHIKGGIGNQLFQYACSYALARRRNATLFNFIDRTDDKKVRNFEPLGRDYALDKFQIPLDNFMDKTTSISSGVGYLSDFELFYRNYTERPIQELNGAAYCQSERYWESYKDEIVSMFRLKPEVIQGFPEYVTQIQEEIENTQESVAVHVRRGDFTYILGFEVPMSYQNLAINRLVSIMNERKSNGSMAMDVSPKFFVFSDDIEFVKKEFKDLAATNDFVFVSSTRKGNRTTSIQDFYLMTKCKHFIIPNSTFAWWAAYLSMRWGAGASDSERIFVAAKFNPKFYKLFGNKREKRFYKMLFGTQYYPKDWIIIDVFGGVEEEDAVSKKS